MKILIVEDDKNLAHFIKKGLKEEGYVVDASNDGIDGEFMALNNKYDLILLDVMLPGKDGLDICRSIRKNKSTPIIFLTAKDEVEDKVKGLDIGANDYITKPFSFAELSARIRAVIRAASPAANERVLKVGGMELDLYTHTVKRGKKEFVLSGKEFILLEYFMRNPDRILTRTMISEQVWDYNFDNFTNVIDVYINFLRKKIDDGFDFKMIKTYRGSGYMLRSKQQ